MENESKAQKDRCSQDGKNPRRKRVQNQRFFIEYRPQYRQASVGKVENPHYPECQGKTHCQQGVYASKEKAADENLNHTWSSKRRIARRVSNCDNLRWCLMLSNNITSKRYDIYNALAQIETLYLDPSSLSLDNGDGRWQPEVAR